MKIKTKSKMISRKLIKNSAYLNLYNMANISKEEKIKIDLPKNGESPVFSTNGSGTIRYSYFKSELRPLPYTIHKH